MSVNRGRLWILVADGEHARVLVPTDHQAQFRTEWALDSAAAHHRDQDLVADRPGRVFSSARTPPARRGAEGPSGASFVRHAVTPHSDPKKAAKQSFLRAVSEYLEEQARRGTLHGLVLIAPPQALHDLRHALGHAAGSRVIATGGKDLTEVPDHAMPAHLAEWWRPPSSRGDSE